MATLPGSQDRPNDVAAHDAAFSAPGFSLRERVRQAAKEIESAIIVQTLEQHRWNRRRTARALNISYRSLMYKMKLSNLRQAATAHSPEAS